MAAKVQDAASVGATTATPNQAFASSPTAGNLLLCIASWTTATGSVTSVSDTILNTWTKICPDVQGDVLSYSAWWAVNTTTAADTVTANLSASLAGALVKVFEFSGCFQLLDNILGPGYALVDPGNSSTVTQYGNVLTSQPGTLVLGVIRGGTISGTEAGWTAATGGNTAIYLITSTPGTYKAIWNMAVHNYIAMDIAILASVATPIVSTQAATAITATTATLNGTLVATGTGGNATIEGFNYGLTTAYGSVASASGSFTAGTFSQGLTGLLPNTIYHFQAFATGPGGTNLGPDMIFFTSVAAPSGEILLAGPLATGGGGGITNGLAQNLVDADNLTVLFFSTTGGWASIDAGVAVAPSRLRVTAAPTWEDGPAAGPHTLQGSNDPAFGSGVGTAFTIPSSPRLNAGTLMNEYLVTGATPARYWRVNSTANRFTLSDMDIIAPFATGMIGNCVAPVMTPPGGNYDQPTRVRITSITTDAIIYYTTDGTTPTTASTLYTGPIVIGTHTQINAIAVRNGLGNSRMTSCCFFVPSVMYSHALIYDDRNYRIECNAGNIFQDPNNDQAWYKYIDLVDQPEPENEQGVNIYKSADLRNWKFIGNVAGPAAGLQRALARICYRHWVIYCPTSGNYVMWAPLLNHSGINVYTAPNPVGPWTLLVTYNNGNLMATGDRGGYDMGIFTDPSNGSNWLMYNDPINSSTVFAKLAPATFTNTIDTSAPNYATYNNAGASIGEGFCMCLRGTTYFLMASDQTGLSYNANHFQTAASPIGPWLAQATGINPYQVVAGYQYTAANSYNSQCQQILNLPGRGDCYIMIADDNKPVANNKAYDEKLHMPMVFTDATHFKITWDKTTTGFNGNQDWKWSLDTLFPTVSGAPAAPSSLRVSGSLSAPIASWTNNEPTYHALYLDICPNSSFSSGVVSEVLAPGTTTFQDTVGGSGLYYRVRAVNANGTSVSAATQVGAVGFTLGGKGRGGYRGGGRSGRDREIIG
jgi:hypothetical protein